ncbi:MAG: NAD-dependent epimerase/dehydratase family protein, partial [Candidatus Poseidoniales archaeon]
MNLATIVITGVAGFLGSSLAEYCVRQGHTVVGFDNLSRGSTSNLSEIIDNVQFRFIELDLTDQQQLETNFPEADVCFHLAAINGTVFFHERALDVISSNIGMTMNVLRLCMQTSTRLVFSSSPEAFGLVESMPLEDYNESKFPAAKDHQRFSYGATKYVEELAMHYG